MHYEVKGKNEILSSGFGILGRMDFKPDGSVEINDFKLLKQNINGSETLTEGEKAELLKAFKLENKISPENMKRENSAPGGMGMGR